jgi:hypothetical protein
VYVSYTYVSSFELSKCWSWVDEHRQGSASKAIVVHSLGISVDRNATQNQIVGLISLVVAFAHKRVLGQDQCNDKS